MQREAQPNLCQLVGWHSNILSAVFGLIDIAEMPSAVSMITTCVTLLTAVIGLVTIITKYCLPENDEEYITRIVKSIQDNDLKNKKKILRVQRIKLNNVLPLTTG